MKRSFRSYHEQQTAQAGYGQPGLLLILVMLLGLLGALVANRLAILDWWRLHNYQPPPAVVSLASQDTMTAYGRKLFYINHPQIDPKSNFYQHCPKNGGEQTIVLGCYHGGENGIFLLSVDDPRLNGVEQVTSAHEMLHAAYDRLSSADKQHVDSLLLAYYHQGKLDARLQKTMAAYQQSEPNDVVNEMHSVFGTEIANLPPELEQYYGRYFTNRAQVAAYAAQYQSVFTSRQAQVAAYDQQLQALKSQIDTNEAELKAQQQAITDRRNQLTAERSAGNTGAYNAGVPGYNSLVDQYNATVNQTRSLITQYNQLVVSRNAIALQQDQLVNELSGTSVPVQQ